MKKHTIITIAASLLVAVGTATASDTAAEFAPMTRSERLRDYLTGTFGPKSLVTTAAQAGLDQEIDRPKEWDSSGHGFAERMGNIYGKHFIRQTLQFGASTVLHRTIAICRQDSTASGAAPGTQ